MEYEKIKTARNPNPKPDQKPKTEKLESKKSSGLNEGLDLASKDRNETQRHANDIARKKMQRQEILKNSIVEELAAVTTQTSSAINQSMANLNELQVAVQEMAAAAEEASNASSQSLKAVIRIEDNAKQFESKSVQLSAVFGKLQESLYFTKENIDAMINAINLAGKVSAEAVENIKRLEDLSGEMGKTVEAVVEVADQTNLLALNAAIEAARAGKYGRGFAVVADEVRTLAEGTNSLALEINEIINQIKGNVKTVADDIVKSGEMSNQQVEAAAVVTKELEEISGNLAELVKTIEEIAVLSKEILNAATEIKGGSQQIQEAAQEAASATEESNASLVEQTRAFNEISNAASALAEMAEDIKMSSVTKRNAEELGTAAMEVSSMVEEVNKASAQISMALEQITAAAEEQSAACEESQKGAEQVEAQAVNIEQKLEGINNKIDELQSKLDKNRNDVENLIKGIKEGSEQNLKSLESFKELLKMMRKIDKTIDSIMNVATKIDLLSLNGSIEAARSGKYGKGFAVVAGDIKQLAGQSAQAVENIKDMVKDINDQISVVNDDIQDAVDRSLQEVEKASKTTQLLENLKNEMANAKDEGRKLLTLASENRNYIKEVVAGITQIANGAEQASQAAQNASIQAQEQSKAVEQIAIANRQIVSLAEELKNI